MNLPPRTLVLRRLLVKDKPVLAIDTGFEADSLEGLRLVKASRGSGWFFHAGVLRPWTTRGVLQEDKKLLVWGDLDAIPDGATPEAWPRAGEAGRDFLKAFVLAWVARAESSDPLPGFSSAAVVPFLTSEGWAFGFLPPDLRGVLDSLQPLGDRLAWDHFRLPEALGPASWAFTSAALAWDMLAGSLPWAQEEEAHLRQEIRELRKTLSMDELPEGPDDQTLRLWHESLTGHLGVSAAPRWKAWAMGSPSWHAAPDPLRSQRRAAAEARRSRRRAGASFWRRKGTLTTALAIGAALVLLVVGSVVWGAIKPDPTDQWTPDQVVQGYYDAMTNLDADQMRKITSFDSGKQPYLVHDQEEASNIYVIRQVRIAYEKQSPVVAAQEWVDQNRPELKGGQILYGISDRETTGSGPSWTVRYRKWVSESEEAKAPVPQGFQVTDQLTLTETSKGWKISGLQRQRQPLP